MKMHETITKVWGKQSNPQAGTFGIEIETEVESASVYPPFTFSEFYPTKGHQQSDTILGLPQWEAHTDNSLRNYGLEFVLKKPLDFKEARQALDDFGSVFVDIPFIKNAPATSVHVHVNFQNDSFVTLANFLTIYFYIENVLMEISGRRSNLFALPVRIAGNIIPAVVNFFKNIALGQPAGGSVNINSHKYGALNVANLWTHNSVEIRSLEGTTDPERIKEWIAILEKIKIQANLFKDPREILLKIKNDRRYFLGVIPPSLLESVSRLDDMLDMNLPLIYPIVGAVDWDTVEEKYKGYVNKDVPQQTGWKLVSELTSPTQAYNLDDLPPLNAFDDEAGVDDYNEEEED